MGLAKRFDKNITVLLGGRISVAGNGVLALIFLAGLVRAGNLLLVGDYGLPFSLVIFVILHAGYWVGIGSMLPNVTAMVAEVAEIHQLPTGAKKKGSYAAVFSLASRLAYAIGLRASGYGLHFIGYQMSTQAESVARGAAPVWHLDRGQLFGAGSSAWHGVSERCQKRLQVAGKIRHVHCQRGSCCSKVQLTAKRIRNCKNAKIHHLFFMPAVVWDCSSSIGGNYRRRTPGRWHGGGTGRPVVHRRL